MKNASLATRENTTSVVNIEVARRRGRRQLARELTKALLETAEAGNTRAQAEKVASLLEIDDQLAAGRQELAQHDERIDNVQREIDDIVVPGMNFLTANGKIAADNIRILHRTQQRLASELDDLSAKHRRAKKVAGELLTRHEGAINRLDDAASDMIGRGLEQERWLAKHDVQIHEQAMLRFVDHNKIEELGSRLDEYVQRLAALEAKPATAAVATPRTAPVTGDKPSFISRFIFWSGVTVSASTLAYVLLPLFR